MMQKAIIIIISFLPAVIFLCIANVIVAHLFVFKAVIFPSRETKVRKREVTVYIPPTQEDIDRIRKDLDVSEPLSSIVYSSDELQSEVNAHAEIAELEKLLTVREATLETAQREVDELTDAFASYKERLAVTTIPPKLAEESLTTADSDLLAIMGRKSLAAFDRESLKELFELAVQEIDWLLGDDDEGKSEESRSEMMLNLNNTLLATTGAGSRSASATIPSSKSCEAYLALEGEEMSDEFIPPPPKTLTKKSSPKPISDETARESDLFNHVQDIKNILSRRDLHSVKLEEGEILPSPISDEGVEHLLTLTLSMMQNVKSQRENVVAQENQIIEYWKDRANNLKPPQVKSYDESDCANSHLVQMLVGSGLDALRTKTDLNQALVDAVNQAIEDPERFYSPLLEILKIQGQSIDYYVKPDPPTKNNSSWKIGRKSILYAVDGPLLHIGFARWLDTFVDTISGYNDNIDAILDWAVGDSGVSIGTSVARSLSRMVRKIP